MPFVLSRSPLTFFILPLFCTGGGLAYRSQSAAWPTDPSVRAKQLIYSVLVITLPTAGLAWSAVHPAQRFGFGFIGFFIGVSISCGIFASGTRRFSEEPPVAEIDPLEKRAE